MVPGLNGEESCVWLERCRLERSAAFAAQSQRGWRQKNSAKQWGKALEISDEGRAMSRAAPKLSWCGHYERADKRG